MGKKNGIVIIVVVVGTLYVVHVADQGKINQLVIKKNPLFS